MNWQFSPYVAVLFLTALFSVIVAYFALRLRHKPGGLPLGLLMLAVAEWSFALALESAAVGIPAKVFWSKVEYLGITSSPVLLLMFAWEFTHRGKWLNRHRLILWIIPIITLGLAATNEWHHLIWTSFTPGPIPGSNVIIYGHGTWFWIAVAYFYLVLCTASLLLIRAALRFRHLYRRQAIVLLVSMIPPWIGNVLYVFELGPVPGQDWTPVGFALAGVMLTWSFGRLQLLDLAPVARDKVIEDMSDGMLVLDAQNRIVDINPAAQELIGVDSKSAIGQHVEAVLAGWAGLVDRYLDVLEAQAQVFVDGTGYIELRISPLYERGDRFSGCLIIFRDITERVRVEERAQRLLEQQIAVNQLALALGETRDLDKIYHTIYEHVHVLMDAEAFIVSFYDRQEQLIRAGYVINHGIVCDVSNFPPIPLEQVGHGTQSQVIHTGEPFYVPDWRKAMESTQSEYSVCDDGEVVEGPPPPEEQEDSVNSALFVPMKIESKTIGVMQVQSHRLDAYSQEDINLLSAMANVAAIVIQNARLYEAVQQELAKRKRAEEALKEYSERLEEMVEERTQELCDVQERLIRQEKLATLGQLAGSVGHELRNPLGVISNAVYFLHTMQPDADEATKEYLGIISSEVRDADKIVSDLLDFSRTRFPDREKIAVSDLVAQVLERRPAPENVEVTTEIAPDLPPVFVDLRQIGQVMGNLVTNAYQSMPEGGRLMIHASEGEGIGRHGDTGTGRPRDDLPITPSPCLRVSISDTGCGISEENMKKVFEPLFTTKAKGIGLGLAISRNLVESNGGSIGMESEVGKGSTFTVRLPLAEQGLGVGASITFDRILTIA